MSSNSQTPEMYSMYPPTYTASPAELNRWDEQQADHGVDGDARTHLEMVHNALNNPEAYTSRPAVDAIVVRFAGVRVE